MVRIVAMGFLFLGSFMAVCSALVIGILNISEGSKILQAVLLIFGSLSFAAALTVKKAERLSWKHWTIICLLAAPGALYTFMR